MEHQIIIEYGDGLKGEHLSYRFENAELRNEIYDSICSKFKNDKADMEHLRNNGGVRVSTYNYSEPVGNEMAPFVPTSSLKIKVLNGILELVKQKAVN